MHPRDTGNRIQVELPDYRERVLVQPRQRTFAIRISIRKLGFRKKPLPITQSLSQSGPRWRTDGRCRINARVGQI